MFGIPGEVFWPTVSFGAMIVLVFAGIVVLRLFPARKSRVDQIERAQLEELQGRLNELDQLTQRLGELEERVDFTERLIAQQREGQRLGPSKD
jgi:tetrahydromethanopterin S-methyltransferase subunit G